MENNISFELKTYDELEKHELYALLQLRAEVFVVEQDCPYQDVDGKDDKALHVLGYKDQELVAYTRIFKAGAYFNHTSIGRVVVKKEQRAYGYGKRLMQYSIAVASDKDTLIIEISAQEYLRRFYNELGFKQVGSGYLEDNIPHIRMIRQVIE